MRLASGFVLLSLFAMACGDESCPEGTVDFGEGCVPVDASVDSGDATADAGDSGVFDGCAMNPEECNGLDDDCDGMLDEGLDANAYYTDADGDTFGDDTTMVTACAAPPMLVESGGDCDDTNDAIHPDATETCDDVDQDCDGAVDEGLLGPVGAPVSLGAIALVPGSDNDVDIAPTSTGYAMVSVSASNTIVLQSLDSHGMRVSGSAVTVDDVGTDLRDPTVVIQSPGGIESAVVGWQADVAAYAASVALDGSSSTSRQRVADSGSFPALVSSGEAVVMAYYVPGLAVAARAINPASGAALGAESHLHDFAVDPSFLLIGKFYAGTAFPSALLMGFAEAPSDGVPYAGYLSAHTTDGSPTRIGDVVSVAPEPGRQVGYVLPAATADGRAAVLAASADASGISVSVAEVTVSDSTSPVVGTFHDIGPGPQPYAVASAGRNLHVLFHRRSAFDLAYGEVAIDGSLGTSRTTLAVPTGDFLSSTAIAMRTETEGALLYAVVPTGGTNADLYFQRIACE